MKETMAIGLARIASSRPHPGPHSGPARRDVAGQTTLPGVIAAVLLLALGGCASHSTEETWWNPVGLGPAPVSPPPATGVVLPVRAADPLAAFAARAQPGQAETVALADSGRTVPARLVRTYNAASGRECRELQLGASSAPGGAPGATYCKDPSQGWVAARALLRGGAVYRP